MKRNDDSLNGGKPGPGRQRNRKRDIGKVQLTKFCHLSIHYFVSELQHGYCLPRDAYTSSSREVGLSLAMTALRVSASRLLPVLMA